MSISTSSNSSKALRISFIFNLVKREFKKKKRKKRERRGWNNSTPNESIKAKERGFWRWFKFELFLNKKKKGGQRKNDGFSMLFASECNGGRVKCLVPCRRKRKRAINCRVHLSCCLTDHCHVQSLTNKQTNYTPFRFTLFFFLILLLAKWIWLKFIFSFFAIQLKKNRTTDVVRLYP